MIKYQKEMTNQEVRSVLLGLLNLPTSFPDYGAGILSLCKTYCWDHLVTLQHFTVGTSKLDISNPSYKLEYGAVVISQHVPLHSYRGPVTTWSDPYNAAFRAMIDYFFPEGVDLPD